MSLVFLKAFLYERIVYSFVLLGRATAPSAIILSFALTIYFITEMQSFLGNSSLQFVIDCYACLIISQNSFMYLSYCLSIYLSIYQTIYLFLLSLSHAHALTLSLFIAPLFLTHKHVHISSNLFLSLSPTHTYSLSYFLFSHSDCSSLSLSLRQKICLTSNATLVPSIFPSGKVVEKIY